MKRLIHPRTKPIQTRLNIPGSKSMTNRALLLAALADGVSEISRILISDDTLAFMEALRQLGIVIQLNAATQSCIVAGCTGRFPKQEASIQCADAGTVARFLIAAVAASKGTYTFDGSPRLRARPIEPLLKALTRQGVSFIPQDAKQLPLSLLGCEGLPGGEIDIDGSESGQFVSALLMIAPFAESPLLIKTHQLVSRPFVEMTCSMMAEFGVLVRRMHQDLFSIPVPQRYIARDYAIEPDLSTASYFFAAAAVTAGEVTLEALRLETSKQGDIKFLTLLEKMGCQLSESTCGVTLKGAKELHGVNVDMRDYSDTFMTLAAIAPFANTPTTITNIGHTRLQESNRISVMRTELEKLNIQAEEGPDWIRIHPSKPQGGVIDAHHDHRIAMSFAVIGLRVPGVEVEGAECVAKTCPDFFTLWDVL